MTDCTALYLPATAALSIASNVIYSGASTAQLPKYFSAFALAASGEISPTTTRYAFPGLK
jgi:hypothetical protein